MAFQVLKRRWVIYLAYLKTFLAQRLDLWNLDVTSIYRIQLEVAQSNAFL